MRAGLALIVLVLNVAAILSILGARSATGRKLAWIAGVVLVPLAGALGWFAIGRRKTAPRRRQHKDGHDKRDGPRC